MSYTVNMLRPLGIFWTHWGPQCVTHTNSSTVILVFNIVIYSDVK